MASASSDVKSVPQDCDKASETKEGVCGKEDGVPETSRRTPPRKEARPRPDKRTEDRRTQYGRRWPAKEHTRPPLSGRNRSQTNAKPSEEEEEGASEDASARSPEKEGASSSRKTAPATDAPGGPMKSKSQLKTPEGARSESKLKTPGGPKSKSKFKAPESARTESKSKAHKGPKSESEFKTPEGVLNSDSDFGKPERNEKRTQIKQESSGGNNHKTKTTTKPKEKENPKSRQTQTNKKGEPQQTNQKTPDQSTSTQSKGPQTRQKQSAAKETLIYVKVVDSTEDKEELKKTLTRKAKTEVNPENITATETCTFCTLTCPSRNKAMRLRAALSEDGHIPLIKCSTSQFREIEGLREQTRNRKEMLAREERELDRGSELVLRNHDRRHASHTARLKKLQKPKKWHKFDTYELEKAELAALEEKQRELGLQIEEFTAAVADMKAALRSAVDNKTFEKELQKVRGRFDMEVHRLKSSLPIYSQRRDIVKTVKENQVCILLGETGSGKSTQLAQYLLEAGLADRGLIACAQPRKVAAMSLARRVAKEMASTPGQVVGYKVGNSHKRSPATKIFFTTDYCLLNECMKDKHLSQFSCVIVDEAHERSLYTDLLLSMIKRCLPNRPDLKVVVTSATIEPTVFQDFFTSCCPCCPILQVPGRAFPVKTEWQQEEADEEEAEEKLLEGYMEKAVAKTIQIHFDKGEGDILVFLTSPAETEKCCKMFQESLGPRGDYRCFQLHGQQQADEQQKVFEPIEKNKRKIVFATNCAETSITIDGIRYVVDTGLAKERRYDHKRNLNSLSVSIISRSSADQRKGRAGRTAPGVCYRLYSRTTYQNMDEVSKPEILKTHLGHAVLKLAELGVGRDMYDFVQSPSQQAIDNAFILLNRIGAIADDKITDKGRWIAKLPLDPQLGLLTLLGKECGLLYDSIVLAAVMSADTGVFYRGSSEAEQATLKETRLERFSHDKGDSLVAFKVYKQWLAEPEKQKTRWCTENSLNAKALRGVRDTVNEICVLLQREENMTIEHKFYEGETTEEDLRKLIFKCYCSSVCLFLGTQNAGYLAVSVSRRVHMHPSSILRDLALSPQWVVYTQLLSTSRHFITGITAVEDIWLDECSEEELGFDVNKIRGTKVTKAFTVTVGPHTFSTIVGPLYKQLRLLEEEASTGPADVVLEANRESGTVSVWTTGTGDNETVSQLIEKLKATAETAVQSLEREDMEIPLAGDKKYGVRAVLGQGAGVSEILTPDLTRKVFISSTRETKEDVLAKFGQFGEIKFVTQFDGGRQWGCLIFKTSEQAHAAYRATGSQSDAAARLEHRRREPETKTFRVRLQWDRKVKPSLGVAFVTFSRRFVYDRCLDLQYFRVDNKEVTIEADKYTADLVLRGIRTFMDEEQLKRALLHELEIVAKVQIDGHRDVRIIVAREKDPIRVPSLTALDIEEEIRNRADRYGFRVKMLPEDDDAHVGRADVVFTDPEKGARTASALGKEFRVRGQPVRATPVASVQIQIPSNVWQVCRQDVLEAVEALTAETPRRLYNIRVCEPNATDLRVHACSGAGRTNQSGERTQRKDEDLASNEEEEDEEEKNPPSSRSFCGHAESMATETSGTSNADETETASQRPDAEHKRGGRGEKGRGGGEGGDGEEIKGQEDEGENPNEQKQEHQNEDYEEYYHEEENEYDLEDEDKNSRNAVLTFEAAEMEHAKDAKSRIEQVMKGDPLDSENLPNIGYLMSWSGRSFLKAAEKRTGGAVAVDPRFCAVTIHGTIQARRQLHQMLKEYTSLERTVETVNLRGDDKPPGVMKAFIKQYGADLEGLVGTTGLHSAVLDFHRHQLNLTGTPDSLNTARQLVHQIIDGVWETTTQERPESTEAPKCSFCSKEIELGQLCRLELCAHAYCRDCLKSVVEVTIKGKAGFPISCCHEDCNKPLAWRDFLTLVRKRDITFQDLTAASVSAFVAANQDKVRFCRTPECPTVYNVSDVEKPEDFECPACSESTCTACHEKSHKGIPCTVKKTCPKCKAHIDTENAKTWRRMFCQNCNENYCLRCGEVVNSMSYLHAKVCRFRSKP